MTAKKPIQRSIEVLIKPRDDEAGLRGMFYANDFGDGATEHVLQGHLTDWQGTTRRESFVLSGVQFVDKETRGAPKKKSRDVALYLAYMWSLGCAQRDRAAIPEKVARAERVAREHVMELWANKGFAGVSEETHLRKRLRVGRNVVHGLSLLHFVCTDSAPDGAMVAAPDETFDAQVGVRIGVNGLGWFWRHGMEDAVYGHLSAVAPLTSADR